MQEVFVRLWQTADRYDPRRAKLVTWVMLIARRHLIDRIRRSAVRPTESAIDNVDTSAASTARCPTDNRKRTSERRVCARRFLNFPELQRMVIERAYLQGFTLREVSEQLNAPLGTVKSALSRGLERLRERARERLGDVDVSRGTMTEERTPDRADCNARRIETLKKQKTNTKTHDDHLTPTHVERGTTGPRGA